VSRFPLRPVYVSLGLERDAFKAPEGSNPAPFDAGVNCGPAHPDCVWLFRGGDCYRFNVRTGAMEDGPTPIAQWGGPTWPALFATGIDAAVWGGPAYPHLHYFFKGALVIRLNRNAGGVDRQPASLLAEGWGSLMHTPLAERIDVAFHDVRPDHVAHLHLVRAGVTVEHDLNSGRRVGEPQALSSLLPVPEAFSKGADVAFFGAGADAETLFLFKDRECCAVRFSDLSVVRTAPIEEVFPGLAAYIPRPQLFMVEEYVMSTFCGDPLRGDYVDRINISPRTKKTVILVTERTSTSTTTTSQSILRSQSQEASKAFYDSLQQKAEEDGSSESYAYQMAARAHGDASADGVWGGEVNLSANVTGGSNLNRQRLAQSTLETVGSQVNEANHQIDQRAVSSMSAITNTERVISSQEETVDNSDNDHEISVAFYQTIQPYLSILSLTRGRVAYMDGRGASQIRDLPELDGFLEAVLADASTVDKVRQALTASWSKVSDYEEKATPLIAEPDADGTLRMKPGLVTAYGFPHEDGAMQTVTVPGIAVAADRYLVRMPSLTPVQQSVAVDA
jgi:hypothetical protein